ncbi:MAG: hypothetical protein Q7T55_25360, partial [Solirubrobacteraceae bacterium]|nr:hypothetical protein [Solirubrobacteraceae bacterium]
ASVVISATAARISSPFVRSYPGGSVPIFAEGFAPGERVFVQVSGVITALGLIASSTGEINTTVTISADTVPRDHWITLSGGPSTSAGLIVKVTAAAKATLTSSSTVQAGEKVAFSVSGFLRGDGTSGQKVGVKVDAGAIVECVKADVDGNGNGSITIPAGTEPGEHTLRFLAGSSCVSGTQDDLPSRSLAATIQVTAAPTPVPTAVPPTPPVVVPTPVITPAPTSAPTPTPAPLPTAPGATKVKSTAKGRSVELTLAAGAAGQRVKVGAKSFSKLKVTPKGKAKIVTVVTAKTVRVGKGKAPKVVLKLTADGKRLLKARRSLKIVVTIALAGHATTTKTFTLKA